MGISASAIRAGKAFVELSLEKTKFVRDLRKLQTSLRSTGNYLKGLGNDMMLLGGTGTLPFVGALKMFADFDDKMRTLKAVTGATEGQIDGLRAQTRRLGATTAFTASQVGDTSVTLARMGLGVIGVRNGLRPMLNLTRATGTETHRVGEAALFAASALSQYRLDSSRFADVCDVMAYAANHSAMDIFDMGEAMKIAAPSAKTVNEDIRDTASALMLLANAGVRGSLAGTSLRKIYQSLAAQSGETEGLTKEQIAEGIAGLEQLRQMGVAVVDPKTGNLRKVADIMVDLAQNVRQMANGEKINFATDIFDLRGSLGALTMLQNPGDLKKFRQELNSVTGYAQKAADEIESGPGGMLRLLKSQFEDIVISIGEAVYKVIEPFKNSLKTVATIIKKIISANQGLIGKIALVFAGTFVLGVALVAIGIYFKILAAAIGAVIAVMKALHFAVLLPVKAFMVATNIVKVFMLAIKAVKSASVLAKGAFVALKTALISLSVAIKAVALAFSGNLLGIFAIVAVVKVIVDNFEIMKEALGSIGNWIAGVFKKIWSTIRGTVSQIFAIVKDSFGWIKDAMMAGDLAGAWKMTLATLVAVFYKAVAPIRKLWGSLCAFLVTVWTVTRATVLQGIHNLTYGALEGFYAMSDGIMNTWDKLWNGVLNKFDDVLFNARIQWVEFIGMFNKKINVGLEVSKITNERIRQRAKRDSQLRESISGREERNRQIAQMKAHDQRVIDDIISNGVAKGRQIKRGAVDAIQRDQQKSMAQIEDAKKFISLGKAVDNAEKKLKDLFDNSQERYRLHRMSSDKGTLSHLAALEQLKNENPRQAESFLRAYADRVKRQKEVIQEEFHKALEEAKADRNITAEETSKLQGLAMRFGKAAELETRYKQMLEDSAGTVNMQVGMATGDSKTIGAWSASALAKMMGGAGSPAERTARATERQNKLMEKNNSYLAEMKDGITYA